MAGAGAAATTYGSGTVGGESVTAEEAVSVMCEDCVDIYTNVKQDESCEVEEGEGNEDRGDGG